MKVIRQSSQRMNDGPPPPDLGRQAALRDVERLAKMAASGAPARTVEGAASSVIQGWERDDIGHSDLRRRLEDLQSDVDAGMVSADDFLAEADTKDQRRLAEDQRDALAAIRRVVERRLTAMRVLI